MDYYDLANIMIIETHCVVAVVLQTSDADTECVIPTLVCLN